MERGRSGTQTSREDSSPSLAAATHLSQNVETIAALHAQAQETVGHHQRYIERTTTFASRPFFAYAVGLSAAAWIGFNLMAPRLGFAAPDPPPFLGFQGVVAFLALLLMTMVLITQNRQARLAERRAELDLQVNLHTEQKVAKLIALVEELRRDLPAVPNRHDPVAAAMTHAVDPHAVVSALESAGAPSKAKPDREDD
jgi:uncharacterized membrane protein